MRKSLIALFAVSLLAIASTALADVRMLIHHKVTDYAAWRKVYDGFDATRKKMGVTAQSVWQSTDDPNDVFVTHDFKTVEAAKAFAGSNELKEAMEHAGVAGAPDLWFTTKAAPVKAEHMKHEKGEAGTH